MQYLGSKRNLANKLLPLILKNRRRNQWYVEPFVGGANMIDKVPGPRIGNDSHYYLVMLLKALQKSWLPPCNISKDEYYDIKNNFFMYDPCLVGFVGFLCSFGAKWWGGYAANNKGDNYAARGSRVLIKQAVNFKDIIFRHGHYLQLNIPNNSLIYCDPPYENTTSYKDIFNHIEFWQWCRDKTAEGHTVFISEYNAPTDFICIKEIATKTKLDKNSQYPKTEKLFSYIGAYLLS